MTWRVSGMGCLLVQRLVEIVPVRVHGVDEAHLPGAGPVLHGFLALDRRADVVVPFVPDERFQAVLLREALDQALAMLPCAAGEFARHAEIERAVAPVRHQVDPAAFVHRGMIRSCIKRSTVMAGLVPAIHVFFTRGFKTWMPATSAGMTRSLQNTLTPPAA